MNTKYETLPNVLYISHVHPSIILIPNNVTRFALNEHKKVYDENIWDFHKVHGVKQYLIQKFSIAVYKNYIIANKNRTTGQLTGNIRQIFA